MHMESRLWCYKNVIGKMFTPIIGRACRVSNRKFAFYRIDSRTGFVVSFGIDTLRLFSMIIKQSTSCGGLA